MLDFTVLPGNNYDFTKYRSYYVSEAAPLCNIRGFIGSNNPDTLAYARHAKMALATGSYYPACNYGTIFSYFTRRTTSYQRCDEIEKFVATHDRELMGLLCTRRMEISNESISVYDLTTK